jgi:hypothetical protein
MPKNSNPKGNQIDTIDRAMPFVQESFDLDRLDNFVSGLGVEFHHYKYVPSPIGQNDRGDYRRSDGVDTITSNGMIYTCAGRFSATMTDNSREAKRGMSGILDPSESRLVLPRFYNVADIGDGSRIYLMPGDRIYVADPDADVKVENAQKMDYEAGVDNVPMFPIIELALPITDSRNIEYIQNVDFCITKDGNIRWQADGKNPGIDPNTGKGRIYSVRYRYRAFWYITALPKEVRITNVTTDGIRSPERMPYHAIAMREYMYHNQNKGDQNNQLKSKDPKRADKAPVESTNPDKFAISVDMSAIGDDGEQS